MKRLCETVGLLALVAGGVSILTTSSLAQEKGGKVTFEKKGIVLHAGAKLSKSDEKALNDVLKSYDKSLYRIETYKKGKLVNRKGELKDVDVDKKTASEVTNAKAAGVTFDTVVFVEGPNTQMLAMREKPRSKELIEQLKPILEKYTKK